MTDTQLESLAADSVSDELATAHDKIANLETALKSSRRIGMAMGILMAQFRIRDEQAFAMLQARARRNIASFATWPKTSSSLGR